MSVSYISQLYQVSISDLVRFLHHLRPLRIRVSLLSSIHLSSQRQSTAQREKETDRTREGKGEIEG